MLYGNGRTETMADTPETSPLFKADGGTLAFSANAGGPLRVRYGG